MIILNTVKNRIPDFDIKQMEKVSNAEKEKIREVVISKIKDAIAKLSNPNEKLYQVVHEVWYNPNPDEFLVQLRQLQINLEQETFEEIGKPFATIKDPIKKNLLTSSENIFTTIRPTDRNLNFYKKDAFNEFIVTYFNKTIKDPIKKISLINLIDYTTELNGFYTEATILAQRIYQSKGALTNNLYEEVLNFLNKLNASNSKLTLAKSLLNDDWFKQWFWLKGGELHINPLDFSTDEFLEKFPKYDLKKGKIFDEYISAVINKYMAYDTFGKVNDFKKILSQLGTGSVQFELVERQTKLLENNNNKQNQLTNQIYLNSVEIPKDGLFYSLSASEEFTSNNNHDKFLSEPKRSENSKTIVVHNIPKDSKAALLESNSAIKDQSAFQEQVDTIAGLIGVIANYSTTFGVVSNMIGGFLDASKSANNIIAVESPKIYEKSFSIGRTSNKIKYFSPKEYIKSYLEREGIYNEQIFLKELNDIKYSSLRSSQDPYKLSRGSELEKIIKEFLSEYNENLKQFQKPTIVKFQVDSLLLAEIIPIFANATLPPKKIEAISTKYPNYYSKILTTNIYDEPVKVNVTTIIYKNTDTTKLKNFKYKIGKNYRFQLSAGLAYTISNFIQSVAKEEAGKIIISNTSQQFRLAVGLHIHLGKGLFLQDNRFLGNYLERSSIYIGVGIPKPLENVYLGYGYDFFPGLKTIGGVHIYRNDKYTIQNNSIIDKRTRYNIAGPFIAVQIDPVSLLKALNFVSKK